MDPRIAEFIRQNRERYTREAVRSRLLEQGHRAEEIDATWDRLAAEEPLGGGGRDLSRYVWIVYWLGAAAIVTLALPSFSGTGMGTWLFSIGWPVAYIVIAYFPARALARGRPSSLAGAIGIVVLTPILVLIVGGGICFATIVVIAGSLGY